MIRRRAAVVSLAAASVALPVLLFLVNTGEPPDRPGHGQVLALPEPPGEPAPLVIEPAAAVPTTSTAAPALPFGAVVGKARVLATGRPRDVAVTTPTGPAPLPPALQDLAPAPAFVAVDTSPASSSTPRRPEPKRADERTERDERGGGDDEPERDGAGDDGTDEPASGGSSTPTTPTDEPAGEGDDGGGVQAPDEQPASEGDSGSDS
jgi:hypothetical protein